MIAFLLNVTGLVVLLAALFVLLLGKRIREYRRLRRRVRGLQFVDDRPSHTEAQVDRVTRETLATMRAAARQQMRDGRRQ